MYDDVNKPEIEPGIKFWKNPGNKFNIVMLHYRADPDKDPKRDGAEWYKNEKEGTLKATWLKEYEIDFTTKAGKLVYGPDYCDFNPDIHLINSYEWEEPCELMIGLDFGQRNPTCALVGVWTMKNELIIVDEYYKPTLPSVTCNNMFNQFDYLVAQHGGFTDQATGVSKTIREKKLLVQNYFPIRVIDPTTKAKNRSKVNSGEEIEYSVMEEFEDHGWEFEPGINDVQSGITRVREYMQVDSNKKTHLYIFKDKCPNLAWELQHYRYRELTEQQKHKQNESEEVVKKDDHAVDALRYLIMTRPNTPKKEELKQTRIQRDIQGLINQRPTILDSEFDIQ